MRPLRMTMALLACSVFSWATAAPLISELSQTDRDIVYQLAQGGLTEIQAGQLAETHSSDPKVKAFAARMVDDHTQTNQKLAHLAAGKSVQLPPNVSTRQAKLIALLRGAKGKDFDKLYADKAGVEAHEETVKLLTQASRTAQDPELKAFASETLTPVRTHLEMAKDLNRAVH
ncbi:MAG: DUF4142 domain-containing protein [Rhodocyclaceae bacterium]